MISLLSSLFLAATAAPAVLGAQTVTVCSADAGQCLEGQSNITRLGAVLSSSSSSYILLPGQYTSSIQPASLQQALGSATSTVTFTTGFSNSTTSTTPSLPLNVQLQPGLLNYPSDLYTGDPKFYNTPQNVNSSFTSTGISRGSIILAANTVAAIEADNRGSKTRVVLWDNVPYLSQLPYSMAGDLTLVSLQSSLCTPACSAKAICTTSGTCQCRDGFTGESCESCAAGRYGPDCKQCDPTCKRCDDGITGTGECLSVAVPSNAPSNCNCANGVCNGSTCTCSPGFVTASSGGNSTQCASCQDGFFRNSSGNCEKCGSGCTRCEDTTGACTQCNSGLTVSNLQPQTCGVASQQCRPGQFASGSTCQQCNAACGTCSGPSNTDCVSCAANTFFLGGQCVGIATVPASGVCSGSSLVANPLKGVCDTCPLGCSACSYDVFSSSSQFSDVKCTKCTPGKVLSNGQCIDNCPDGTFANSDGTCTACASSCGTCINKADFCLTCKNNQLASAGTCVSNCPSNMFASNGACTLCHPDCATCSGAGFNQCLSCPSANPILTSSKRCVATCSRSEYFDSSSASCKSCDSSCGSCSGGGASACLSCNSSKQVLRAGACVNVDCGSGTGPTSGLGVCMAELVVQPNSNGPPATIPPLDPNAQQPTQGGGKKLTWWQILLIVLGALLLLLILLLLWRRYQRKKRAQQTEQFRENLKKQGLWRKLWRNPFAAWWARRKSAALARRSQDVERMSDAKGWAHSPRSDYQTNESTTDRRTAVGVPRSLSRGSWVTMGQQPNRRPSFDNRSYLTGPNLAGLGRIHEDDRYDYKDEARSRGAPSFRSFGRPRGPQEDRSMYSEPMSNNFGDGFISIPRDVHSRERGESQFYGQEIEQEDVRSERTYDPYQFPSSHSGSGSSQYRSHSHRDSRGSEDQSDLVSMIKSDYTEGDRYDDRYYNHQRSRTRDERSYRGDYPASVSTRSQGQSRRYRRDDREKEQYSFGAAGMRLDSPSMYSQSTGYPHPNNGPGQVNGRLISIPPIKFDNNTNEGPLRDAVLSSRFSMSTAAASAKLPKRKPVPTEPVPELKEPPRQLSDAEMYKMSKLFPELLALVSPTKKEHKTQPLQQAIKTSPSRNPFRI
ncbi:hypothetical protein CPB86DRAFT_775103 [Serendipita vermifera]|nr:hypothetical protein CPB86DRAFT_775103 [Serendipita vermifera]